MQGVYGSTAHAHVRRQCCSIRLRRICGDSVLNRKMDVLCTIATFRSNTMYYTDNQLVTAPAQASALWCPFQNKKSIPQAMGGLV